MNEEKIAKLCMDCFSEQPKEIERCAVGQGNYVYIVELVKQSVLLVQ